MSVFRLATSGLSDHENDLLAKQLKMLRGRTENIWQFSEDIDHADVVIAHSIPAPLPKGLLVTPRSGTTPAGAYSIDWPIRLFGLLDLLQHVERTGRSDKPPSRLLLARQLAELKQDCGIKLADLQLLVSPMADQIWADEPDLMQLVEHLHRLDPVELVPAPFEAARQPAFQHSLKALLWALALREDVLAQHGWNQEQACFRISAWPLFGTWETAPSMLRLAALYSRQHASIAQGVEFTGANPNRIASFLHACDLCGLGLSVTHRPPPPIAAMEPRKPESLLSRLRRRLGL